MCQTNSWCGCVWNVPGCFFFFFFFWYGIFSLSICCVSTSSCQLVVVLTIKHHGFVRCVLMISVFDDLMDLLCLSFLPSDHPNDSESSTLYNKIYFYYYIVLEVKTSPSFAEAAMGRIAQGTKVLAEGGYEKIFLNTFETGPEERLQNCFACYLSTSAGPVMGVLYVSTAKIAYSSDNPISYRNNNQTEWSYYKVLTLIRNCLLNC